MSDKDYKFIVILLLVTFAGTLASGLGFIKSVVLAFTGTFSLLGAILLANVIFGDEEFGWGHYIIIAVVISVVALFLSSS
jgi:hypothetical protein